MGMDLTIDKMDKPSSSVVVHLDRASLSIFCRP